MQILLKQVRWEPKILHFSKTLKWYWCGWSRLIGYNASWDFCISFSRSSNKTLATILLWSVINSDLLIRPVVKPQQISTWNSYTKFYLNFCSKHSLLWQRISYSEKQLHPLEVVDIADGYEIAFKSKYHHWECILGQGTIPISTSQVKSSKLRNTGRDFSKQRSESFNYKLLFSDQQRKGYVQKPEEMTENPKPSQTPNIFKEKSVLEESGALRVIFDLYFGRYHTTMMSPLLMTIMAIM